MVETLGGATFETNIICPKSAAPDFLDGFGKRLQSLNPTLAFNDWYEAHRHEVRSLLKKWGVLVVDDVLVEHTSVWRNMVIDPIFNYLPWHSDGVGGEETIMLAHIDSRKPRMAPTLVAPSIQIQGALRQTFLDEASGLYPGTRDELIRICGKPDASVDFFEGLFLQFQHATRLEHMVFKNLFERSHQLADAFVYRHCWRVNSVLLFDTAHYERSTNSRGFNKVVHGRMPVTGENIYGVQPFRRLV